MNKQILITDKVHSLLIEGLRDKGFEVAYSPKMPYADVCDSVRDYDGIIINSKVICNQHFLESANHLDFIGRLGSGLDIIDLAYAKKIGVEVISSPEGNSNAVGEHCLAMLLGLLHNIGRSHQDVQSLHWNREQNRGTELLDKKIGILGFGHTGPAFAKKLSGLGVDILVYDKYKFDIGAPSVSLTEVPLEIIFRDSDIISIHLPLTEETTSLVDASFFKQMKKGAIIINTSRGLILDSTALLQSLEKGHLKGACLDVLENEKPETWTSDQSETYTRLLSRKDVIITPHVAGWTHRSLEKIASILLSKICNYYGV